MRKTLLNALKHGSGTILILLAMMLGGGLQAWGWSMSSGKEIYFYHPYSSTSDVDWGNKVYFRIGTDSKNEAWKMDKVSGTERLYHCTSSSYSDYGAYCVSNNCGWTGNNSVYKVDTSDQYDITKNTVYFNSSSSETKNFSTACRTIIGGTISNTSDGCDYYNRTVYDAANPQKFTVNITQPANGTISISCSNSDNITTVKANEEYQVLATTILTITVAPNTGYTVVATNVEGDYHTSSTNYVVDGDITISATVCASPTVGAVSVTGDISSAQCAGNITLSVSPTGGTSPYSYQWFSNSTKTASGGTAVTDKRTTSSYKPTSGSYYYYCVVYSDGECASTYYTASSCTEQISIKDTPVITASATSVTNYVPVTLTATVAEIENDGWSITSGSGGYLYKQGSTSAKFKGNVESSSTPADYTIQGTATNGCSGSTTVTVSKNTDNCN